MVSSFFICALGFILLASTNAWEPFPFNPLPMPGSVVVVGRARFTILTPQLIRYVPGLSLLLSKPCLIPSMEYSKLPGEWEDRPTWAFLNRNLFTPHFVVSNSTTQPVLPLYLGVLMSRDFYLLRRALSRFSMTSQDDHSPSQRCPLPF